jgi:hypothetical protein
MTLSSLPRIASLLLVSSPFLPAASVTLGDPVPNLYPEPDYITDGGIPYRWTVEMTGSDSTGAAVARHVGAWSWDEDGNPTTTRGWTHTSDWVALTLLSPAQLTVTLSAQSGISAPTQENATALAGGNLYPGMSLYSGWDGDGSDDHTYNNQGPVGWAEDITFLGFQGNDGSHAITQSWTLPAGATRSPSGGILPRLWPRAARGTSLSSPRSQCRSRACWAWAWASSRAWEPWCVVVACKPYEDKHSDFHEVGGITGQAPVWLAVGPESGAEHRALG